MLKGNRGVKQQQTGQTKNNNSKREKNNNRQDKNKIKYGEGEVNEDRSQTKWAKVQTHRVELWEERSKGNGKPCRTPAHKYYILNQEPSEREVKRAWQL